jgi:hypothetical protein
MNRAELTLKIEPPKLTAANEKLLREEARRDNRMPSNLRIRRILSGCPRNHPTRSEPPSNQV